MSADRRIWEMLPPRRNYGRWFVRYGARTWFDRGFRSKEQASQWIEELGESVDWRVGYMFRLKGHEFDASIVNRRGEVCKP